MDAFDLNKRVLAATQKAEARVRATFDRSETRGRLTSYEGGEGVWETAEGIGILRWRPDDLPLLRDATGWLCRQQHEEGGYAPNPDVPSTVPYVEPSARVTMSLAGTYRALGGNERRRVNQRLQRLARWLVEQQDDSGGWGSRPGFPLRMAPTSAAIQALRAFSDQSGSAYADAARSAAVRGVQWLRDTANDDDRDDGGYGLRPGAASNVGSSGQAAWALSSMGVHVPQSLQDYLQSCVDEYAEGAQDELGDIPDSVGDPAEEHLGVPYKLTCLEKPWALIGLLSAHGNVHGASTLALVDGMLRAAENGVWTFGNRWVWPTYFHVIGLRLWSWVYAAHSQAATVDVTALQDEAAIAQPLRPMPTLRLPDERAALARDVERVGELDARLQRVLIGIVMGETQAQIAAAVRRRRKTVEGYAATVRLILGTSDKLRLFEIAVAAGLVPCVCGCSSAPETGAQA